MEFSRDFLNQIADSLEAGEKCFIHKQTFEMITYPEDCILELDPGNNAWREEMEKVKNDANFIQVEKMSSRESFVVMEDFTESIQDQRIKTSLLIALRAKKPFSRFKRIVESLSEFRELWFAFRREKNITLVKEQLNSAFQDT